jgi:lipoprotein-releasing system ATP-binding protein
MIQRTEILRLEGVTKTFPNGNEKLVLFEPIDFSVNIGDSISIMGESASGKSTLLHIAAGLEKPTTGKVFWKHETEEKDVFLLRDSEISKLRNLYIGFIFQNNFLLEDFSPLENIMVPALISGESIKNSKQKATALLEEFKLDYLASRPVGALSGGEKQRVAICRALVNGPRLIFADEPTGALDHDNAQAVEDLLVSFAAQGRCALVLVTHNPEFASKCSIRYRIAGRRLVKDGI